MILLVNGPNLNLLGERDTQLYGTATLADVEQMVREACAPYGIEVLAYQSNWEGALIDFLQENRREAQGAIINPGAFTASYALHDCIKALPCPVIEVHISNVHAREEWRRKGVLAPACLGHVTGLGVAGYHYAATHLCGLLAQAAQAATGEDLPAEAPESIPVDVNARGEYEG